MDTFADDLTRILDAFRSERERLKTEYETHGEGRAYLAGHTAALDRALVALARAAGLPEQDLTLVAVGGYGRGELFPYSDIDLLILTSHPVELASTEHDAIARFTTALWEFGLSVGASVRSREEFAQAGAADVSVATTYLEHRVLCGDAVLFEEALQDFYAALDARAFFRDKMLELARRHQRHDDTPYALEPNLKESPGGLRDIQVFLWCAKAAGLAESLEAMAEGRLITEREMHALARSLEFLTDLRINLHLLAGRHEDRLIFDLQEALASRMGYKATPLQRASEALMKRYYLNAKTVTQLSTVQLQAIADRLLGDNEAATPVRLEAAFVARGDEMDLVSDDVYRKDPNALLRTFLVYGRHRELSRLSTRLLRALWHASFTIDEAFRAAPANRAVFMEIMKMPRGTYHALKLMNTWGLLSRFLPGWSHTVGQMQHDLYHIFTVDQHTLRTVRNVRRFARSEYAHEYPFCSKIMAELPDNWRVVLGALFHDVGKGLGGRHEVLGAEKADEACRQFALSESDREFVVFLVREHLTMSQVAQKQDISDPAVVERFLSVVKTKERLDALYLLTVADIRATSPKVWTQWKGQLLESLYRATLARLSGGAVSAGHVLERRREAAEALLEGRVDAKARDALWKQLDLVYFMRHTPEEIANHTERIALRMNDPTPLVHAEVASELGGIRLFFYLPDRAGLFLRCAAYLGKCGLSVIDSRISTTRHGYALDTFLVADAHGRLAQGGEAALRKFERDLAAALVDTAPLEPPKKIRLSRRSRHFPIRPVVSVMPDESGKASILTVVCTDRLGLLNAICEVLFRYGVNLQTAKIATLGERVEDVFLIDGAALASDEKVLALEAELVEAVSAPKG